MTKWQTRQALYLLGLTGILYLFSCKSQVLILYLLFVKRNFYFTHSMRNINYWQAIVVLLFSGFG